MRKVEVRCVLDVERELGRIAALVEHGGRRVSVPTPQIEHCAGAESLVAASRRMRELADALEAWAAPIGDEAWERLVPPAPEARGGTR